MRTESELCCEMGKDEKSLNQRDFLIQSLTRQSQSSI